MLYSTILPKVSIYLFGSIVQNWLNQKRNYNGDYRLY